MCLHSHDPEVNDTGPLLTQPLPMTPTLKFFLFQEHVLKPQEQLNDDIFAYCQQATQFFGLCLSFKPQGRGGSVVTADIFPRDALLGHRAKQQRATFLA